MPMLTANRQLCGDYGVVVPGQQFTASPEQAAALIARGLATACEIRPVTYQAKVMIVPNAPEVAALPQPFRDVRLPDAQPEAVATESDPVLRAADVSESRTPDRSKRGSNRGPSAGR